MTDSSNYQIKIGPNVVVVDQEGNSSSNPINFLTNVDINTANGVAGLDENAQLPATLIGDVGDAPITAADGVHKLRDYLKNASGGAVTITSDGRVITSTAVTFPTVDPLSKGQWWTDPSRGYALCVSQGGNGNSSAPLN